MWKKTLIPLIAILTLTPLVNAKSVNIKNASLHVDLVSKCDSGRYHHDNDRYRSHRERNYHRRDGWKRYDNSWNEYNYRRYPRHYDYYNDYDRGRFVYIDKKVWVPGHWDYIRTHCGRNKKIWVDGHWEWRNMRVWKPYRGHCR